MSPLSGYDWVSRGGNVVPATPFAVAGAERRVGSVRGAANWPSHSGVNQSVIW